jgi:phage/conjugal plasmid C-4 type zinc finger TraR family protein
MDFAQQREEEMRQDALDRHARRNELQPIESAEFCILCECPIPEGRRLHVPGVQTCIECQEDLERAFQ